MNILTILALFLIAAFASAETPAEPVQFFAQVFRHYGTTNPPSIVHLTHGVVTGYRHVVVPATLINNVNVEEIRVYLQSTEFRKADDIRTVEERFIHPDFAATNPNANNIAVLHLSESELDANEIAPRNLGALSAAACTIYGFEGWHPSLTTRPITVSDTECGPNVPFCASFNMTAAQREGYIGSPVLCENQDYVAGIATRDVDWSPETIPLVRLNFISIESYQDWIRYVSGARLSTQVSLILITLGVVLGKILL
ncbi:hypothetical protein PVAND_014424 [Polypedilum vanderplanki]|uniref:Peptidase S1 domain-containing protein n=1 Tax=Polypedilum vanderplanki TaxID=319348 RepID=A0A9J6BA57_POLVA|nr:hypothetical protein PVAND_014424 [Polypedilum vanderplanki]